jgi:hypothetical protein
VISMLTVGSRDGDDDRYSAYIVVKIPTLTISSQHTGRKTRLW